MKMLFSATAIVALCATGAMAQRATGHITATATVNTTETFMGMSNRTPPNERAAASQGVRTETTSYSVDVTGPRGQVTGYVAGTSTECNNCTFGAPYNETSSVDLPGADR